MALSFPVSGFSRLVVLDLETSGLRWNSDCVIEVGAVALAEDGRLAVPDGELSALLRLPSGRRLPAEITRLTGITPAMLEQDGVEPGEAAVRIAALLDRPGTLLAAYNAQFDLCFLYSLLRSHGCAEVLRRVRLLDAMTVYKDRRPYPHRLADAVAVYGLRGENTHRAIDDARVTWELLCAMREERPDLERYVNLFGYHPKYGVSGPRISSVTYRPQGFEGTGRLYEA